MPPRGAASARVALPSRRRIVGFARLAAPSVRQVVVFSRCAVAGWRTVSFAVMLASFAGCGSWADDLFCADEGCGWAPGAWQRLQALANPPPPPPDPTNRWADNPD